MPHKHLGPFWRPRPRDQSHPKAEAHTGASEPPGPARLFRIAYASRRPCRCRSCICLTPEEQAYEGRVFAIAKAWHAMLQKERSAGRRQPH